MWGQPALIPFLSPGTPVLILKGAKGFVEEDYGRFPMEISLKEKIFRAFDYVFAR